MKIWTIDGQEYRLPNTLTRFQETMYVHLIQWKWRNLTTDPGIDGGLEYDTFLPARYEGQYALIYPGILDLLKRHLDDFPFRVHPRFNHVASSQAANINLFLPVLRHPQVNTILGAIKPDFAALAPEYFDHGYCLEYWGGNRKGGGIDPGPLGDKTAKTGTDADIAIAYTNHQGELCLWLVEHKLTEKEFTTCGGYNSRGRAVRHVCASSFSTILQDKNLCYYHDKCRFHYWDITEANQAFFANPPSATDCPFRDGKNQLWRNQLLALRIAQDEKQPYQRSAFSVVKHHGNHDLDATLADYKHLIGNSPSFSVFTSADLLAAADAVGDPALSEWIAWYRDLYMV